MLVRGGVQEQTIAKESIRKLVQGNAGFWKIPGGDVVVNVNKLAVINKITESLVGKYKNLQCTDFASDLRKLLDKEGIGYRNVEVHDLG
jgi:hypothetical protein